MLYHLLYPMSADIAAFNVFRYITFRSIVAFLIAAIISILWGKAFILFMKKKQFGQIIRNDGPESHFKKAGTPTMGGVVIIGSVVFALAFAGNFMSLPVLVTLCVMLSFTVLGFIDDYLKVLKKNTDGVSAKVKLLWQFITGVSAVFILVHYGVIDTQLYSPFFKDALIDLGPLYCIFGGFVIVASSNAVNLTDGLDGLAIGPIITSAATLGILSYAVGHREIASYLYIPYTENIGELTIMATAIIGAGVGFLWYNSYPAQIFMGDVGSLSLGGTLGTIAVLSKNELLFVLIGGVFVVEALSVILQVGSYKLRKKRIFKMAPIHHHFELMGWPEPKVIVRFWIISIFLALVSIATLKMR
jgi:phospho-N-acetylmuramoyl-pentapeptide-transferase